MHDDDRAMHGLRSGLTHTDNRRMFWLGGIAVLIVGFLVAALVLPMTSDPSKGVGPAVHVPKTQNIPPDNQKLNLDTERK